MPVVILGKEFYNINRLINGLYLSIYENYRPLFQDLQLLWKHLGCIPQAIALETKIFQGLF